MDEELFKYWDSDKAKKKQTALTRLSNGLAKELLGDRNTKSLFSDEEVEAIEKAREALDSVKYKFTHLKEKRLRDEQERKRAKDARQALAKKLSIAYIKGSGSYPLTTFSRNHFYLLCMLNDLRIGYTLSFKDLDVEDSSGVVTHDEEHFRRMRDYNVDTLKRELEERVITWVLGAWTYSGELINKPEARLADLTSKLDAAFVGTVDERYKGQIERLEKYNRAIDAKVKRSEFKIVQD